MRTFPARPWFSSIFFYGNADLASKQKGIPTQDQFEISGGNISEETKTKTRTLQHEVEKKRQITSIDMLSQTVEDNQTE